MKVIKKNLNESEFFEVKEALEQAGLISDDGSHTVVCYNYEADSDGVGWVKYGKLHFYGNPAQIQIKDETSRFKSREYLLLNPKHFKSIEALDSNDVEIYMKNGTRLIIELV